MDSTGQWHAAHLHLAGLAKLSSLRCVEDRGYALPDDEAKLRGLSAMQVAARALHAAEVGKTTLGGALSRSYTTLASGAPAPPLTLLFLDAAFSASGQRPSTSLDQVATLLQARAPRDDGSSLLLLSPTPLSNEAAAKLSQVPRAHAVSWVEILTPPTASPQVPSMRAMRDDEAAAYLTTHGLLRAQLPQVASTDIQVRWHGWPPGTLVEFKREPSIVVRAVR